MRPLAPVDIRRHTPNASRSEWPLVLVIAAQTSYRQTLATSLSSEGFRVEGAADAREGFKFTGICGLISFFLTRSVPTTRGSSCVKC